MDQQQPSPCIVDETILADPANEVSRTLDYFISACAYLANVLHEDQGLRSSELHRRVLALMSFCDGVSKSSDRASVNRAILDLERYAAVGRTLWYLRNRRDPQLRRELGRLAESPDELVGNQYLFYVAGTLASRGYDVRFVTERGDQQAKTPDLRAEKNGRVSWIEVNAKQPKRAVDTPQKIWEVVRDLIAEKKQKFADSQYAPGVIVADISPVQYWVNDASAPPELILREELRRPRGPASDGGFVYRLYEDSGWRTRSGNDGNIIAYLVDEFSRIDRAKYHVNQCLITVARQVETDGATMRFPKHHVLLVIRESETFALSDLARAVYVIDASARPEP